MAIEKARYAVVTAHEPFEIRDYEPHILAESIVAGDLDDAASRAFNRLFWFISGDNLSCADRDISRHGGQRPICEKIKMTSPVEFYEGEGNWAVRFIMPASYTLENLPEPMDFGITVRQVPAQRRAVIHYSSMLSFKSYLRSRSMLESWIESIGLISQGDPIWVRYREPFVPWFLRRNEVHIPIRFLIR